jgi:hypothetical protein
VNKLAAAAAVAVALVALVATPASAQDDTVMSPEQELVEQYAPLVMLKAQEASCDADGEPYAPQSVDIVLDNPDVLLRQVGNGDPILKVAPTAADLYGRSEGFFLDFPGSALSPGCIYEQDFDRYTDTVTGEREPVVYAHIATQDDQPDQLAVQYWFYWYYNDWNNKHESDWEGIQLLFDVGTVEDALETAPVSAGYAQHEGGERADWDSAKLTREGDRPVVYPSAGSHASYYGSAVYIGRSASEGFGCDTTDGPSHRTDPAVILLPDDVSGSDDPFAWLAFGGRWGERQNGPFNGPTGPQDKERWTHPVDWHDSLRSDSVVVPAGDSQADVIINSFCDIVEAGSGSLIALKTSPLRLFVSLLVVLLVAKWLVGRTVWTVGSAVPMIRRRRAGEIIRTAAGAYRRRARVLITIGLVYIPTSIVVGLLASAFGFIPIIHHLTDLAAGAGETSLAIAFLAGSIANLLAYVAVNAMVASYYQLLGDGKDASGAEAVRRAWSHAGDLALGFLRSLMIVLLLSATVIGIPFAIWYLVRVQFMAQAVVTEDLDGRRGLARSAELVTGRWWHTALMVALFNLLVVLSGGVVGLLLLVLVAGIPLWLFSGLITLVYALIVPLAAVALTLLFGDAVAESQGLVADDDPEAMSDVVASGSFAHR